MVLSINLVDEFALTALKAHITYDSQGILARNWSTKSSHYSWYGISCNAPQQRVSAINLSNMGLEGTIAPQVGNLSFLVSLDLSNNYFHGSLPKDIGNQLTDEHLTSSISLPFQRNHSHRNGNLTNLIWLDLGANDLTGSIPATLGQLQKLQRLYNIAGNRIQGSIPNDLCHLKNLGYLHLILTNCLDQSKLFWRSSYATTTLS
ncbi:putative receptor-like protein kinase [Vitis vinifera]|uniref:Putative receptor-like protein kinase n=1 Tax=Vitis vinifera TaxID=29760 RepID=A0A438C6X3_VITVI|nr:putative receptor-like protein kinase [Vitis vinifera]